LDRATIRKCAHLSTVALSLYLIVQESTAIVKKSKYKSRFWKKQKVSGLQYSCLSKTWYDKSTEFH
jgi:hypothetical protein